MKPVQDRIGVGLSRRNTARVLAHEVQNTHIVVLEWHLGKDDAGKSRYLFVVELMQVSQYKQPQCIHGLELSDEVFLEECVAQVCSPSRSRCLL